MDNLTIKQAAERSKKIREHYRSLEVKHHAASCPWKRMRWHF